jgi:hypothetical protein
MLSCIPVPGTSICIPARYRVEELGLVDPTGSLYFPDRYLDLVTSDFLEADPDTGNFTITYNIENIPDVGNIEIQKKSEDGGIKGICFKIEGYWYDEDTGDYYEEFIGWNANGNVISSIVVTTDKKGFVSTESAPVYDDNGKLLKGLPVNSLETTDGIISYKITELGYDNGDGTYTLPDRYVPNEPVYVTLDENRLVTYTCENTLKKGKLQVVKTSEDGKVGDVWFRIFGETGNGNNISMDVVTKEDGTTDVIENLPIYKYGTGATNDFISYKITELGDKVYDDEGNWTGTYKIPNRYRQPWTHTVTLSEDTTKVTQETFNNILIVIILIID